MPLVAERYASALLSIAVERECIDRFGRDMQAVSRVFEEHDELRAFLAHAGIDKSVKKDVIRGIFEKEVSREVLNLLMLLVDKHRIGHFPGIAREYRILADREQNILNIEVWSSHPLEDAEIDRIKKKYTRIYGASGARVDMKIDNKLIGGLKIKIGDRIIDGTLAARLKSLREQLLKD